MADDPTPQDPAPTPDAPPAPQDPPAPDDLGDAGKKALEAERAARKKAEQEHKAAQKELERLRTAQMNDTEKAIAEAEARGRTAASTMFGQRLAGAEFVAAAARRNPGFDASAVLDDLNLAKYVSEDGEPDGKGIAAAVERLVPAQAGSTRPAGDVGQGVRDSTPPRAASLDEAIQRRIAESKSR
jgi:hypothetical protein